MRHLRFIVLVLVVVIGIFGFGLVFIHYGGPAIVGHALTNPQKDGLSFQFEECDRSSSDDRDAPPVINWETSRTARITGMAEANCGTSWIVGDYAVAADSINLGYQAIVPGYAACDCAFRVTYRIEDLPKKAYKVHLRARPAIQSVTYEPTIWKESPWKLIALITLILSLAGSAGLLVSRQLHRGNLPTTEPQVRFTRRETIFICVVLALAAAVSTFFWYQVESERQTSWFTSAMVTNLGRDAGRQEADKDFAAGTPRWYRFRYSGDIPEHKGDRRVVTMHGGGTAPEYRYREAFYDAYNSRMDDLVKQKERRPGTK